MRLLDEEFLRKLDRLVLACTRAAGGGLIGEHSSRRRGTSLEFADYRSYVPGDDFRRIDWSIYARLEALFLRLTEAKEDIHLHLLVDYSRSMHWGQPSKLDVARRTAAALGYVALAHADRVSAAAFASEVAFHLPTVRGRSQIMALLRFLEAAPVGGRTHLERAMHQYGERAARGGVAVVISDLLCVDGYEGGLRYLLSRGHEVLLVHVLADEELEPRYDGDLLLEDAESGETLEVSLTPAALGLYRARVAEWRDGVRSYCQQRGIDCWQILTSWPLEDVVLKRLQQRAMLR